MEESCIERQENELQALQAIYMDDFQDLREELDGPPKVCLKLTPLQSVVAKEVHARVDLIVQYTSDYPNRSPKLYLSNAEGISNEDVSKLQNELRRMAADLVGEVMVLQLAHHVQTCLHKHNKPQLSFYDKMMANKRKEEERILAAEQQKLQKEIEANKEREENEKREIEEELQRRGEAKKESRRRRNVVIPEKNSKMDTATQSSKPRDGDPSLAKEIPIQRKQSGNSIALFQPSSPKKTDGMPSGYSLTRRRRSSESLGDESFTGTRVISFNSRGEHVVHCGKCLGQGSSGSRVYSAMDITIGDLVVVCEWSLSPHQVGVRRTLSITDNQQQDMQGRLMKQVSSIEQEILSLINRVSHPNLTHYLAVNVHDSTPVKVQVLAEYVGGGDLGLHLLSGGLPLAQLREYTHQLVEALCYLHGKAVVHKDLRLTSCRLDSDGNLRLADYSVGKRLSDLYQVYGGNAGKDTQSNMSEENNKTTSRYGKTGDIYSLGILVLSLALGEIITGDVKEIPTSLPSELRDFLSNCLKADERNRWSASQLLEHSFITPVISNALPNGQQEAVRNNGVAADDGSSFLVDQPEHEEPVPDFSFFSGVPGKSRVKCEFEELQFLGKGGFGNVIKVRNKLDNCLYAVKRIPLNPKSSQFTKRIMREVQLISRLNHENVVRYYNSWIESAEEQEGEKTQSGEEKAAQSLPSAASTEDSLLKLNKIEAPSMRSNDNNVEDSWWQEGEEPDENGADSSSSGLQESFRSPSNTSSKSHSVSFFNSKSESSEGIVFKGNADESVLQFGDLLDTESDDSEEVVEWQETGTESSTENVGLQYLYIQMEYCEKSTLRNLIDEGLHQDKDRVWRLFREIVEGLAHIHTQGIIHRDLKPVNLFLDSHGRIKIGDFGLATTHGMTRGGMGPDLPDSNEKTQSPKSSSTTKESMTGKVGTALYVAPELGNRAGVRVKYSQKVDLYSLGIIFFEMCYKPLTTSMERVKVLGNLRTERIIFPGEFDHKSLAKETIVLKWLLKHNPEERPTSQELLQSQYIPPKIEDGQLDEVLKHTLATTNSTRYQRLMKAMFSQHVSSVKDVTYDIDVYGGFSQVSPRAILAQQMVHEIVKSVFLLHGALRLRTSLLAPRSKLFEQLELAVSVMDHSGTLVTLPFDLRIPFARYIARNGIVHMKRFDIGCVYRDKRILGSHPKELYECVFDIVTSTTQNLVPDAEVLLSVAEIIKEFPSLDSRNYYIRINHAALMKSYLTSVGISEDRQSELLAILQEIRSEKDRNVQIHAFVESLQLSDHTATALCEFLDFEGPVNKLREHLIGTMKRKSSVGQTARQSFHDLEGIISHVETFGIGLPVVVDTSMVYNFNHFSGLIFQFVAANKRKRKRGGVDILAAGGRYDKLINHFRRGAEAAHPSTGAVGVSIAIEKIVAAVLEEEKDTIPSAFDVFVCSAGHNPMLAERMCIARDLWKVGIKATICYDSKDMTPLEELQEFCKQGGIQHMVVLKEQETGSVRVRSLDKEKISESRVQIKDLVDHLQGKLSTRPEPTESSAPLGNKGAGTQSGNESTSTPVPEIKISFNTQEKMAWNTKKRHESSMMSKIKPLFSSKNHVEVIGVDLPGAVLRSMAAILDLDSNEDAFDASVAAIADKNPRYKKYLGRVCDDIREFKVSKKVPMVFVYSVRDEMFQIFF